MPWIGCDDSNTQKWISFVAELAYSILIFEPFFRFFICFFIGQVFSSFILFQPFVYHCSLFGTENINALRVLAKKPQSIS